MAILKKVPGIEAVVLINGKKAQEYDHNGVYDDSTTTRYIESVDDADYSIRLLVNDEYEFEDGVHDALGIRVFIDHAYKCSTIIKMNRPIEYHFLRGSRTSKPNGGTAVTAFRFVAQKLRDVNEDDEMDMAKQHRAATEGQGEIMVKVARINVSKGTPGVAKGGPEAKELLDELLVKADGGRHLTHGTGSGAESMLSKKSIKFACLPIDKDPIATFIFMYRSKDVIKFLNRAPITEELLIRVKDDEETFVQQQTSMSQQMVGVPQHPSEDDNHIKREEQWNGGDIYGGTPIPVQRQVEATPEVADLAQALDGNMAVFQNLLLSFNLTDEQKKLLAQQLMGGVNDTAQNLQTPALGQSLAATASAADNIPIKEEHQEEDGRPANLNVALANRDRITYSERQTDNGIEIDLTTPKQQTFIKPDPDANAETDRTAVDVDMTEAAADGLSRDNSSWTISGTSAIAQSDTSDEAIPHLKAEPMVSPPQAIDHVAVDDSDTMRQASMSTADGIASPMTPNALAQEPSLERADATHIYNVDAMQVQKAAAPKSLFARVEARIIASIEAADRVSSSAETVRQRKDSISSDASIDLNAELQRARSSHPTITTANNAENDRSAAISPTPQPADVNVSIIGADFMIVPNGAESRMASISTQGIPVETVDIDMTTGRDIHEQSDEEDDMSPSRQLIGSFEGDEGFEIVYSPIKGAESTLSSAGTTKAIDKPTEGFEAALTADTAQVIDQAGKRAEGATTSFPAVDAEIVVPNTPTGAAAKISLPASVHTDDHDFIDIDTIIPQTPVKHNSDNGLIKNFIINTPTPAKATPSTVEKLRGIENLNIDTPRKRLFGKSTPASTVGSPVTGNAGSRGIGTPIKRERMDDGENDGGEVDTPSKKMKYQAMGSQDKPISFDSDDELSDTDAKPVQPAEVPHSEVAKNDAQVPAHTAHCGNDAQNQKEKSCIAM